MDQDQGYVGVATTLDEATRIAHLKIRLRPGNEYNSSRVVDWGMQCGGFIAETKYWVRVEETVLEPLPYDPEPPEECICPKP